MTKKYSEYKSQIFNEDSRKEQMKKAREENAIEMGSFDGSEEYDGKWIPFNLEREYVDFLIEEKRYKEASEILERMKKSYRDWDFGNHIESYEYRLNSILHANHNIEMEIQRAKKEFNEHTILIITIVVGIITIFGSANQNLVTHTFCEGILNFLTICISIIFLSFVAFWANKYAPIHPTHTPCHQSQLVPLYFPHRGSQ